MRRSFVGQSSGTFAASSVVNSQALNPGEETVDRLQVTHSAFSSPGGHASGDLHLGYFTASRTETITRLEAITGTPAAAATPTLVRMGVYQIAANGDGTLVASIPNDTTMFSIAHTRYPRNLSVAWSKVAGQRYAIGLLIVSAGAMPLLYGRANIGTGTGSLLMAEAPARHLKITGLADLPSSFLTAAAVSAGTNGAMPYFRALA